ncbi:hypothetical protein KUTeg_007996 [Tegillarca granosa]|uniref:Short-chain collagen C4-like n=1 Tax=Tegillarca granosa TaxID=220873 RepID=A0ABQ9FEW9_TEGGR|nr:hypothetical protein KUTeg_007996 [Tegillarca granosa]
MTVFKLAFLLCLAGTLSFCTVDEERLLIDQIRTKLWMVEQLTQNREETCNRGQPTPPQRQSSSGGIVYVRWGNTECPEADGTERVYSGFIGGSHYGDKGGATNYLCLPKEPQWAKFTNGTTGEALIHGAEYEDNTGRAKGMFGKTMDDNDPPCAVCHSTSRGSQLMIPARTTCADGWTLAYMGYLMTGRKTHAISNEYVCVDKDMVIIPGTAPNNDNAVLLYLVEAKCGGTMTCPPYVEGREIACVVCTK